MKSSPCALGAALVLLAACVPDPTFSLTSSDGGAGGDRSATASSSATGGLGGAGSASTTTTAATSATSASAGTGGDPCSACPSTCANGVCAGTPIAVGVGVYHSCALVAGGSVRCWGGNDQGQLGNDSTTDSHVPVPVMGLSTGVLGLAVGPHDACAITAGSVACWGGNAHYELGNTAGPQSLVPVVVAGLSPGILAVAAGGYHTCALTSTGAVQCWGYDNSHGQLGNDSTVDSPVPVAVKGLSSGVLALAAGADHTCAVTAAGGVVCWGDNARGQLGDGTTVDRHFPVAVKGLSSGFVAVAAGNGHSCARTPAGAVMCWGNDGNGQLGDGTILESHVPVAVKGLGASASAITAGGDHTCAVTAVGALLCWGNNGSGELGIDSMASSKLPAPVKGLSSGVSAVAAGSWRTCAVAGGAAKCWGDDSHGGLGDDSTAQSSIPVDVTGL
jgi:alpha-tubulin suppressor-like RCC1 family protein